MLDALKVAPIAEPPTSEAAALAAIVAWSANCPAWQRDALRRLCENEKLDATDSGALLAICKGTADGTPLGAAHTRDPDASDAVVTLMQLHHHENVNALANGERLSFGKTGITVIYGDNGAGKSGYARVLKQLCRARSPKGDTILSNIYTADIGLPKASIDFCVGTQKHSFAWTQGMTADPMLSAVSVFDSRTANVHVDKTNDLAYTPLPLKILAALAEACQDLKAKLTSEISALEGQKPAILAEPECKSGTPVGQLIAGLSAKTTAEQIEDLAGLNAEEEARLQVLQSDLGSDPARAARQLQTSYARLNTYIERLRALEAAVTEEKVTALSSAAERFTTAQAAALAASTDLFADEPLPDIGTDLWKELWEAARAYSRSSAYRGRAFPVTGNNALCLLCQQELSEAASKRLSSFEAFVKDESKRREDEARRAYEQVLADATAVVLPMTELQLMLRFVRDELGSASLAEELRRQALMAAWRLRAILRTHGRPVQKDLPPLPILPFEELTAVGEDLSNRAKALLAEKDSPERRSLIAKRDEFADRKWLAVVKDDVLAQVQRYACIDALKKAIKDTATKPITMQSAEIAQVLVTDRLRARFAKEIDKLGIARLAIELQQTKTNAGVPFFQVRLIDKPAEPVGKVLSEGEHRCVALAAFLAELATVDARSAIVFDDPVCSLDHLHRDMVAARLAEEGQHRQVIVFTHDIAFLLLLEEACRSADGQGPTPITYRLISRGKDATGFCHQDPPANVMPLDNVIDGMHTHLSNVTIHHVRGDQARWQREVTSFQDQLRIAWERAVEEVVCPVIKRLARKVDTTGLLKLTVLTPDDCARMRKAFGRCSMLLHSQPGELNPCLPHPDAIKAEIEALAQWLNEIRARQARIA